MASKSKVRSLSRENDKGAFCSASVHTEIQGIWKREKVEKTRQEAGSLASVLVLYP